MKNKNLLDQFLLVDQNIVEQLVSAALLNKRDKVLEIGAGAGVITRELARKAGRVIAIEIDQRFTPTLKKLPKNVKIIFGNALDLMNKIKFNKVVSSLPSSLVEPLMHKLTKNFFEVASFLVPLKFVNKLIKDPFFTAYFESELIQKVGKKSFYPQPKTNWALVKITKKTDPLIAKDYQRFLRQYLYEHPKRKLKNTLMEATIRIFKAERRVLTKNQARHVVKKTNISPEVLENPAEKVVDLRIISLAITRILNT